MKKRASLLMGIIFSMISCTQEYEHNLPSGINTTIKGKTYITKKENISGEETLLLQAISQGDTTYFLDTHNNGTVDLVYKNGHKQSASFIDKMTFGNITSTLTTSNIDLYKKSE